MYFRNSNTQGIADFDFFYGNPGDRFVGGDRTADGTDTPGVFRPSDAFFYLKHTNTQGNADEAFGYGNANSYPVAAKWGDIPAIQPSWPFGPFFPPHESWGERFTGGMMNMTTASAIKDLEMVLAAGASVVIDFHGKKYRHQNPDETFNLELWKARIDTFVGLGLESYIADGTILAHYMTDEPKSRGSWGGEVIPNDVIDEMARYSKSI